MKYQEINSNAVDGIYYLARYKKVDWSVTRYWERWTRSMALCDGLWTEVIKIVN